MNRFDIYIYFFLEEDLFPQNKSRKKSYIQYQTHYIQKKRNKGKKETRNIKRRKKIEMGGGGGSNYVIHTIDRHNPFKLFSLYTFYAID